MDEHVEYLTLELRPARAPETGAFVTFLVLEPERGYVTEILAVATSTQAPRAPTQREMLRAAQTLEKIQIIDRRAVDERLASEKIQMLETKLRVAEQRCRELEERDLANFKEIAKSIREIAALADKQIDDDSMKIVAEALEIRIEELAMTRRIPEYARTKEVYEKVVGRSWVEEN